MAALTPDHARFYRDDMPEAPRREQYLHTGHMQATHHGRLSMYLRPMGAEVPATDGESDDRAQARQA